MERVSPSLQLSHWTLYPNAKQLHTVSLNLLTEKGVYANLKKVSTYFFKALNHGNQFNKAEQEKLEDLRGVWKGQG